MVTSRGIQSSTLASCKLSMTASHGNSLDNIDATVTEIRYVAPGPVQGVYIHQARSILFHLNQEIVKTVSQHLLCCTNSANLHANSQ